MRELCGPSAFACVFTEKLKHLSIECRDIAGLSATDPIPVAHNFLIHPVSARVANVILDGVKAGQGAALDAISRNQEPWTVTNYRSWVPGLVNAAHKFLGLF